MITKLQIEELCYYTKNLKPSRTIYYKELKYNILHYVIYDNFMICFLSILNEIKKDNDLGYFKQWGVLNGSN